MSTVLLFLLVLLGSTSVYATPASPKILVGCVNRLPDGTLQFGTVPSGQLFLLRGQTDTLAKHVNQLVRVSGETTGEHNNSIPTLAVSRVQALAKSCTAVLAGNQVESVPGKVGEDAVAVPRTTTSSDYKTTPGSQTQVASTKAQSLSSNQSEKSAAPPPDLAQVAQSQAAANVNAGSVERTEILPGSTLGVSGSAANPGPAAARALLDTSYPDKSASVVVTITDKAAPKLSPTRVVIRTGQVVKWLNSSAAVQELIANPEREPPLSGPTLPPGAKPFDSGLLRQGQSFEHRFSVPGVYHYMCKVNGLSNSLPVMGEVVVQR